MEILTTTEIEGTTLNLEQVFTYPDGNSLTIKEIFSIDGEVFIAIINHQTPYNINVPGKGITIQTGRFIMPAKQFVLQNSHSLS